MPCMLAVMGIIIFLLYYLIFLFCITGMLSIIWFKLIAGTYLFHIWIKVFKWVLFFGIED